VACVRAVWICDTDWRRTGAARAGQGRTDAPASSAAEPSTKRQRQNAARREGLKLAKQEAEAERLAVLAQHKRELERTRMAEQAGGKAKLRA